MYNKEQLQEALKQEAKNAIFERDFQQSFNKYLADKQKNYDRPCSETVNRDHYRLNHPGLGSN